MRVYAARRDDAASGVDLLPPLGQSSAERLDPAVTDANVSLETITGRCYPCLADHEIKCAHNTTPSLDNGVVQLHVTKNKGVNNMILGSLCGTNICTPYVAESQKSTANEINVLFNVDIVADI